MGRFYATLTVTIYADTQEQSEAVADRIADLLEVEGIDDSEGEIGDVVVTDVERDTAADEEG